VKKENNIPIRIASISELHRMLGLPKPLHPLVSLMDNTNMVVDPELLPNSFLFDFYKISYKRTMHAKMKYGQGYYDFDEGGMIFTAPNQLISIEEADTEYEGYSLIIHPDFIRNYPLGRRIRSYGFFSYDTHEALHLSEKEKNSIMGVLENINEELHGAIDDFSQDVMVSYIEVLLNYSNRFYKRQFITRKAVNHELLSKMEQLLEDYFDKAEPLKSGMLTVEYLAAQLHLSPRYLSDMLRSLTGHNAQQHIHEKLIEKAKEKLSTTNLSVSEIAYDLGFGHPQSFSKLFKNKTSVTPLEFRESFN
jgi:AraC family transcriptional regulator, transcriptional activator of pobA